MKLLVVVGAVVLIAFLSRYMFQWSVDRYARNVKRKLDAIEENGIEGMDVPDLPLNFGYKCGWYAVRSEESHAVASALGISRTRPCNWRIGIRMAYEGWVYITPSMTGWTLVCSSEFIEHEQTEVRDKLEHLSQVFGEACFFATHRVVGFNCWGKAEKGRLTRYYAYLGERSENLGVTGDPTTIEQDLNLINTLGPEAEQEGYFDREDITRPSEDVVMKIAHSWSIDPSSLETRTDVPPALGLLCRKI